MRVPLFAMMSAAKTHHMVPDHLRHSGILSFQWLAENSFSGLGYLYARFSGTDLIDQIVARVLREKVPVRSQEVARIRELVADRTYDSGSQFSLYQQRHVSPYKSGCFTTENDGLQRICGADGRMSWQGRMIGFLPVVSVKPEQCKYCGRVVFPKDTWKREHVTFHCGGRDCRRIEYLSNVSQSRGGVDLTPAQRRAYPYRSHNSVRVINYLSFLAKEQKREKRNSVG